MYFLESYWILESSGAIHSCSHGNNKFEGFVHQHHLAEPRNVLSHTFDSCKALLLPIVDYQRRKAVSPANASMPAHAREPNPSKEPIAVAAEAFVVAVPEELVVELVMVAVEKPVAVEVKLVGRLERAVLVVNTADNPVTLVQVDGAGIAPAMKFTAAHLKRSAMFYETGYFVDEAAYLVESSIRRIHDNSDYALGAGPRSGNSDAWLAVCTKTALLDGG